MKLVLYSLELLTKNELERKIDNNKFISMATLQTIKKNFIFVMFVKCYFIDKQHSIKKSIKHIR